MPSPRQILEGIIGFTSKKEQERHKWGAVAGGVGGALGGGMMGAYTGVLHPQAQAAWMRSSMEGVTDSIHDAMGSIDESVGEGWKDPRAKAEPFGKGAFTEAEKKARLKAVKIAKSNKQAIRRIGRNAAIGAAALGGIGALTGYANSRAGNHPGRGGSCPRSRSST